MRFTLLGSGAVRPDLERWGPAQVVQVANESLLFDCGRGASMRLVQQGFALESIRRVFFTHPHYDHNCDFAYLFLTGWVLGREEPVQVVGPRGTQAFCEGLFNGVYKPDIDSRRFHPLYSERGCAFEARDVLEDTLTMEEGTHRIRIVHTLHKPHILDSLAYRVEADGKSVVVVGDTTPCPALRDLAEGADLLVHECTFPTERIEQHHWGGFHTSPGELGRWARERGVRRLLLKHFAVQPGVTVEAMVDEVRSEFGEERILVGEDGLSVDV
jgi:ribonuclease Z